MEQTENITVIKNAATKEVTEQQGKVGSLIFEDRTSGEEKSIELSAVFVQIGLVPNSQFLEGLVETNKFGEIIIDDKCRTSVPGIYAAGDVTTVPYKQIIVSLGEGAKAGLSAFEDLVLGE